MDRLQCLKQKVVILDTATDAHVDVELELGEVTEVITVEADVPLLETENSTVGTIVKNKRIANMPLLGRRAAQLVRFSGFVVQNGNGSQFQIAGGRSTAARRKTFCSASLPSASTRRSRSKDERRGLELHTGDRSSGRRLHPDDDDVGYERLSWRALRVPTKRRHGFPPVFADEKQKLRRISLG